MAEPSSAVVHRLLRFLADAVALSSSSPLSYDNDNNTTTYNDNITDFDVIDPLNETAVEVAAAEELVKVEEEHEFDALTTLLINVCLIGCLMISYAVKKFRIYYLPESAGAIVVGMIVGGMARLLTPDNLIPFEFSPEVFFFVLLPPIIFEAGYSLHRKDFFDNIGAITLYASFGTIISTFCVGGLSFYAARLGLIRNISHENPIEALLFGALISSVDPVATLSIMGNADLGCDRLLYSLVFGESVLNDAIAISLFKVFAKYYNPAGPDWREAKIPSALGSFVVVSVLSILVGVGLGLVASFVYKHTELSLYPNLEVALLFSFCYLCYATGESLGLSGIMALFFEGMVLSHYNSYNLSPTAHVASEQIFATLATISETAVFLYMGMGVFTGRFKNYDILFSVLALCFCLLGRFLNIFPLSWIANICRSSPTSSSSSSRARSGSSKDNHISLKMQCVLWFAGLRGAVSFALAMNMPGPNREVYATATLSICIVTTVVCGGLTNHMLTAFGMKTVKNADELHDILNNNSGDSMQLKRLTFNPAQNNGSSPQRRGYPLASRASKHMYQGTKQVWTKFEDEILKVYFGGSSETIDESPDSAAESASMLSRGGGSRDLGDFEMGLFNGRIDEDDSENDHEDDKFIN